MLDYAIIFFNSLKKKSPQAQFTAPKLIFLGIYILIVKGLETEIWIFLLKTMVVNENSLLFCVLLWEDQQRVPELESKPRPRFVPELLTI